MRQQAVFRAGAIAVATAVLAGAGAKFGPFGEGNIQLAFVIGALGLSLAGALVTMARSKITEGLLGLVCGFFGFRYQRKLSRPGFAGEFDRLDLLPSYNRQTWEDEVSGARHGADFILCEAHLKKRSSGKKKRTRTVFRGQLFVIDYHKKFLGETVVRRDAGLFNGLMKPGGEFQRVGLASAKFEKIYEAWSTDQVEARDLLDPLVLERFEELDRLFDGAKLRAAFTGGKLCVALEAGDKLNMGSMFTPLDGPERVEKIMKEFDLIFDLMDVLVKRLDKRLDGAFSVEAVNAS